MNRFSTLLVLALASGALADVTIEQVEKELTAASEKIQSLACKMSSLTDMKMEGGSNHSDSTGTMEFLRKGGKTYMRNELSGTNVSNFGGQEMKQEMKMVTIADGEFAYTVQEMMGQKQAMKTKQDASEDAMNVKASFDSLRESFNLKVMPDEKIDGQDAYVIEATPKEPTPGMPISKLMLYFSKSIGIAVKTVAVGMDGTPVNTTTLTEIKTNPPIAADRFVFTAPEGVQVQDMTQMPSGGGHP